MAGIRKMRRFGSVHRELTQPEEVIAQMAKDGKLAIVGKQAAEDSFLLGFPVTQLEGNNIVQIFPDGTRKILKSLAQAS